MFWKELEELIFSTPYKFPNVYRKFDIEIPIFAVAAKLLEIDITLILRLKFQGFAVVLINDTFLSILMMLKYLETRLLSPLII